MRVTDRKCPGCGSGLYVEGWRYVCAAMADWGYRNADRAPADREPKPECQFAELRTTFEIPIENLPKFLEKMTKLCSRAKRLGVKAPSIEVRETITREVKQGRETRVFHYAVVEVSGEAPRLDGWSFAAVVDHDGEENVIRAMAGIEGMPAEFRTSGPTCEHCKVNRRRVETFVLRHDDGRWARVGRSCLADFTGHRSPAMAASAAEIVSDAIRAAREASEDGGGGNGDPSLRTFLAYCARTVREHGWASRKGSADGKSTCDIALLWIYGRAKVYPRPEEQDFEMAESAIEWARGLEGENDFEHNLRAAAKREVVSQKNSGIAAYIVGGWVRKLGLDAQREIERRNTKPSEWVGEVGKRFGSGKGKKAIPALRLTVVSSREVQSAYTTYLTIFVDELGNRFKWFGGECLEVGRPYEVTGTVKAHEEYQGTKQTVLTRVSVEALPTPEETALIASIEVGQWRTIEEETNADPRRETHKIRVDAIKGRNVHFTHFVCGEERMAGRVESVSTVVDWYPVICAA